MKEYKLYNLSQMELIFPEISCYQAPFRIEHVEGIMNFLSGKQSEERYIFDYILATPSCIFVFSRIKHIPSKKMICCDLRHNWFTDDKQVPRCKECNKPLLRLND